MTEAYRTAALEEALQQRAVARRIFDNAAEDIRAGNPKLMRAARLSFVQAEEELDFWENKIAALDRPAA